MADYNSSYTGAEIDEGVGNGLAAPTTYAPIDHAASASTYGAGTGTKYGHLMLSDSTSSTSSTSDGVAATPAAVKAAKDAIPSAYTSTPAMNGTGAAGSSGSWAKGDHVHPVDTSRAAASDLADLGDSLATYVRPNLLDNWYFVGGGSQQGGGQFPINQRGEDSYTNTSSAYNIDRWAANDNVPTALASDGWTISPSNGASTPNIYQFIENPGNLWGKTLTMSILSQSGLVSSTFTLPGSAPGSDTNYGEKSTTFGFFRLQYILSGSKLVATFFVTAGTSHKFYAAKLEIGSSQTLAHNEGTDLSPSWVLNEVPIYQRELARCQRFFYAFDGWYYVPQWSTNYYGMIQFPVTMRTMPTISEFTVHTGFRAVQVGNVTKDAMAVYTSGDTSGIVRSFFASADL